MKKVAPSGDQSRAFYATIISRMDENALNLIDRDKLQKAIDNPAGLIHSLTNFINNDMHHLSGPLIIRLSDEPFIRPSEGVVKVSHHVSMKDIKFKDNKIQLITLMKPGKHFSGDAYKKLLDEDQTITALTAKVVEFFEEYQYDTDVAEFLNPYKKHRLYQFITKFKAGNGREWITFLYWDSDKVCWCIGEDTSIDNWTINGYAFVKSELY